MLARGRSREKITQDLVDAGWTCEAADWLYVQAKLKGPVLEYRTRGQHKLIASEVSRRSEAVGDTLFFMGFIGRLVFFVPAVHFHLYTFLGVILIGSLAFEVVGLGRIAVARGMNSAYALLSLVFCGDLLAYLLIKLKRR